MKRSYVPDPKPERRARKRIRTIDPAATMRAALRHGECVACGEPAANGHHVVSKGAPYFGDDVEANVAPLCGSGTARCHGAFHGNPYVVEEICPNCEGDGSVEGGRDCEWCATSGFVGERRDREWVASRVGEWIERTPGVLAYVLGKLGDEQGRDFLRRVYYVDA